MRKTAGALAAPLARRRGRGLEVQIHPADIRGRVRYLFMGRVELTAWCLLALAYVLFLAFAAALAPKVARGYLGGADYQSLAAERELQGERLQALVGRLDQLARRGEEIGDRLSQIRQVYGLAEPRAAVPGAPIGALAPAASIYAGAVQQGGRLLARLDRQLAAADRLLQEAREFERSRGEEVRGTPSVCPLRGGDFVLTSGFGRRQSPFTRELQFHAGLDLAAPAATPIHAPADGAVAFAGTYPVGRGMSWWRLGNLVIVRHGERFFTVYGHCGELKVRTGQKVRQGEVLATVGRSGWSTNPLLYYEIRRRGADGLYRPTDPRLYILDYRWPNEERLLAGAGESPRASEYDPLPVALPAGGRSSR